MTTASAAASRLGGPQDAWRRRPVPDSVDLARLGAEEWNAVRDTVDEQRRRGHFRVLYPTSTAVRAVWPLFQAPRFLNGVLAAWVCSGGVDNPWNRVLAGLPPPRGANGCGGGGGAG
ncbi:unnamed protein product, partial [Phaeothamnion confervicola]